MSTGLRDDLHCEEGSKYFQSIHECVAFDVAASVSFVKAFKMTKLCDGDRSIETLEELESLRYCNVIEGSLRIEVHDEDADFSAIEGIERIEGWNESALLHD
jgi:hypothetical protein